MRSKMKTLVMLALVCSLGMGSTYTPSAFAGEIRQLESFSINGEIVYDNTEESGMVVEEENGIRSRMLLGYEYVPGHERLINQTTVFDFAKIYSTSVNFCEGASPSYTLI